MSANMIMLHGRLSSDPVVRHTRDGAAVANFNLAVSRDYKNQDGERTTDFFRCTAWRTQADFIQRYFSKGQEAVVIGRHECTTYTDRDGVTRDSWAVQVDRIDFCGSKKAESESNTAAAPAAMEDITGSEKEGELPF